MSIISRLCISGYRSLRDAQGTVRKNSLSLKLGFSSDDYGFAIDLGLPLPCPPSRFDRDPEIKVESIWTGPLLGAPTSSLSARARR